MRAWWVGWECCWGHADTSLTLALGLSCQLGVRIGNVAKAMGRSRAVCWENFWCRMGSMRDENVCQQLWNAASIARTGLLSHLQQQLG